MIITFRDVRQISLQGLFVWGTIAPNVDLMLMIYIYIYNIYIYSFPHGSAILFSCQVLGKNEPQQFGRGKKPAAEKKIVQRH